MDSKRAIEFFLEDVLWRPVQRGVTDVGRASTAILEAVADFSYLCLGLFRRITQRWDKRDVAMFFEQVFEVGYRSLPVAITAAVFTGMALALQLAFGLARFGAKTYVGTIVAFALVRELAPVLTSLLVGGRVGSGFTAEIGSMAVTEQIDAMRALGSDPLRRLIMPRVLACMLVFPLLTTLADILGVAGGMVVSYLESGVGPRFFMESVLRSLKVKDVASGIIKTIFFGFFVGVIACNEGIRTHGGTVGLGQAVKKTVVSALVAILVSNFLLSKVLMLLW
ncbi:MAG: ABC transporter permease [Bdellovibrionota bacterium]